MAVTKPDKDIIRFQIEQLRMDKIIYAVDALAFSFGVFLFLSFGFSIFPIPQQMAFPIATGVFALAIAFTVYVLVSNVLRLKKIRALEKQL